MTLRGLRHVLFCFRTWVLSSTGQPTGLITYPEGQMLSAHVILPAAELHACVSLQTFRSPKQIRRVPTRVTPQAEREPRQSAIRTLSSPECFPADAVQSQRPPAYLQ